MVEVFKTNASESCMAETILQKIHQRFGYYNVNFDLEDCDKILRVESGAKAINVVDLIKLVQESGYIAEVLPDSIPEL